MAGVVKNSTEFETLMGAIGGAKNFSSLIKVTVCGSDTIVGVFQITLSPASISIVDGKKTVSGEDAFQPPAFTLKKVFVENDVSF